MIAGRHRLRGLNPAFAVLVEWCLKRASDAGLDPVLVSGLRSRAEQTKLYRAHQRGGPLAAPPGRSLHEYGLAVDVYAGSVVANRYRYDSNQDKLRKIFIDAGLEPVRGDPPHFQYPGAMKLLGRATMARSRPARERKRRRQEG